MKKQLLCKLLALIMLMTLIPAVPVTAFGTSSEPVIGGGYAIPLPEGQGSGLSLRMNAQDAPSQQSVYDTMIAMKDEYYEGRPWTNSDSYIWNGGVFSKGYGCAGFAFLLSDAAFGTLPARRIEHDQIVYDELKTGDILRINGNTHSVIILEVLEDYVVIAEGNYNSSIHWGRILTRTEVLAADYVLTRYPTDYTSPAPITQDDDDFTWSFDHGTLYINGFGPMNDFDYGAPWNSLSDSITSVVVSEGVTSICSRAFRGLELLSDVSLPDSLTEINEYAFSNTLSLKSITIPQNVTSIPNSAFSITGLEEITVLGMHTTLSGIGYQYEPVSGSPGSYYYSINPDFIVYGYYNSEAVSFAKQNGLRYVYLDGEPEPSATPTASVTPRPETTPVPSAAPPEDISEPPIPTPLSIPSPVPVPSPSQSFTDVMPTAFYSDSVQWAVSAGITKGTSSSTFSPNKDCSRGEVVTFLWRCMGKPTPKTTSCPFTDVRSDAYYYQAMLWAVENGITKGTSHTTFSPDNSCTRSQVVTFLWRSAAQPDYPVSSVPFIDINPNAYYYPAVLWASNCGITSGMTPVSFAPEDICNRAQIVTMLFRAKTLLH